MTAGSLHQPLLLLALLCCFTAVPADAGKYAYGEQFVRQGQYWWEGDPSGVNSQRPAPLPDGDIQRYQQMLEQLEQAGGPYDSALAEPLAALGQHYRGSGDLATAQAVLQRALHVVRVNDGLYSERQVPILQSLLDIYRFGGQWLELDERYDYYFRLFGHGKPPFTDIRLRAALGYLRWQREALRLGIDEQDDRRLLSLYQLNQQLLDAVAGEPGLAWKWQREFTLSQLKNLYLLQDRIAPAIHTRGLVYAAPALASGWEEQDIHRKQLERIQQDGGARGARLLDAVMQHQGAPAGIELARLHLAKGDWFQWLGREPQAAREYESVVAILQESGEEKLLQQWLGQPVELPDNGVFWQPAFVLQNSPPAVIQLTYDVSVRGKVSNLSSDTTAEGEVSGAKRLKRKLRQVKFRPRWGSGGAEPVERLQRVYSLIE